MVALFISKWLAPDEKKQRMLYKRFMGSEYDKNLEILDAVERPIVC